MRSQPVEFLAFVEDDIHYAYNCYDSWLSGGSMWFRDRFRETVSWIEWNPRKFPKKHRFFRRAIVRRSDFGTFFAIEPEVTTVVAVRDMRDNPAAIRRLLLEGAERSSGEPSVDSRHNRTFRLSDGRGSEKPAGTLSRPRESMRHVFRGIPVLIAVIGLLAIGVPAASADQAADMEAAMVHYRARRDAEAKAAFEGILARNSRADEALYYLARLAKRQRDWATVAARLEEAIKIVPDSAMYWGDLGEAYGGMARGAGPLTQLSLARKTLAALKKATTLDPNNLAIREGLIEFYQEAPWIAGGGMDKAYDEAKAIAKIDPFHGAMITAGLYQQEERWADAENAFRNALRVQPGSIEANFALAQLNVRTSRYDEAFAIFEDILQANPQHYASLYQIGRIAALSGKRLERGEAALREYLASPVNAPGLPSHAHAWHRLGNVLERMGNAAGAREAYSKALELDPKLREADESLGKLR